VLAILDKARGTTCATSAETTQLCQELGLTGAAPEPVGGPHGGTLLAAARAQHFRNANLVAMPRAGVYRDYVNGPQSWTVASAGSKTAAITAGGVPILTFAGWLDADRWNTNLTGEPVVYPDRAAVDRMLLTYTSAPLRHATTVTGLGRVTINVTSLRGGRHGALYAYLEDVRPNGHVTYITEGELALADRAVASSNDNPAWRKLRTPRTYARADASPFPLNRRQRVTFDLLPTSVLFRPGDRIRIAIAAADPDSFELMPSTGKATYLTTHSAASRSFVELPIIGRS
jgi:predicted acyl esterase